MSDDKRKALEAAGWKFGSVHEFLEEPKMNVAAAVSDSISIARATAARREDYQRAACVLSAEVERLRAELAAARKDWCGDDEAIKQQALRVLDAAKVEGDSVYVPRMGALAEMMADAMVKVCDELAVEREAVKSLGSSFDKLRDELAEAKAENVGLAESHYRVEVELAAAKAYIDAQKQSLYGLQKAAIRLGDRLDDAEKELAEAKAASVCPVEIQSVYVNKYLGSVVVFIGDEKGAVEFDAWLCDRVKERSEG